MSEEIDKIVENLFRLNMSLDNISIATGYSLNQISDIIVSKGLDRKNCNVVRDRNICSDYEEGVSILNLSSRYHLDRHKITDILRKYSVYKNRQADYNTPEKRERNNKIVSLYESGKSISEIAKEMELGRSLVSRVLRILGVPMRPQHQLGHSMGTRKNAKYHFDIDFFEDINTEHKAYWLGFLYADGYVGKKAVVLNLADKDLKHIHSFQEDINALQIPIIKRKDNHSGALHLRSVKMINDLKKQGCMNKKTFVLSFPETSQVPKDLINHFMRGYFDGDGSIQAYQRKNRPTKDLRFEVVSTYEFLNGYENELRRSCNRLRRTKRQKAGARNIQSLRYGGNLLVKEIYDFLYKDATIYLTRKKSIFESIIGRLREKTQDISEIINPELSENISHETTRTEGVMEDTRGNA